MKLKTLIKVPTNVRIAFSGGVDSLVAAHYYKKLNLNVELWHFNHECEYSDLIEDQCRERAKSLGLPIVVGNYSVYTDDENDNRSTEDRWRRARYRFLRSNNTPFITAHHLDDAVETWLFTSIHGNPKLIPVSDDLVLRPFLSIRKGTLEEYANKYNLIPVRDEYNFDKSKMRNYMRFNLIQHVLVVNPGLHKTIKKKYLNAR